MGFTKTATTNKQAINIFHTKDIADETNLLKQNRDWRYCICIISFFNCNFDIDKANTSYCLHSHAH